MITFPFSWGDRAPQTVLRDVSSHHPQTRHVLLGHCAGVGRSDTRDQTRVEYT